MTCISRISFILRNSIHSNSYKCVIQSRHLKTPSPILSMILGTDLSLEKKIKFLQHDSVSWENVTIQAVTDVFYLLFQLLSTLSTPLSSASSSLLLLFQFLPLALDVFIFLLSFQFDFVVLYLLFLLLNLPFLLVLLLFLPVLLVEKIGGGVWEKNLGNGVLPNTFFTGFPSAMECCQKDGKS